jgi:hypothetical protein
VIAVDGVGANRSANAVLIVRRHRRINACRSSYGPDNSPAEVVLLGSDVHRLGA